MAAIKEIDREHQVIVTEDDQKCLGCVVLQRIPLKQDSLQVPPQSQKRVLSFSQNDISNTAVRKRAVVQRFSGGTGEA